MCYIWDDVGYYVSYGPLIDDSAAHSSGNGFLDTANLTYSKSGMRKETFYAAYRQHCKKFCNINVGI
jgi:hypothetical protein